MKRRSLFSRALMSKLFEVPHLAFAKWRKWIARPRPSHDMDVPSEFGMLGLYMLACSDTTPPGNSTSPDTADLPEEVIYIGMSRHVDRRLESSHNAVARYKKKYADEPCSGLWFSSWSSEWSSWSSKTCGPVERATLVFYERALILAYAKRFGRLPALNRG